mmetsp:Transcript_24134/g.77857  ORF Transcript_24134/g.77857 Transcript_24134/m.77857 type:complete len:342 (+) Transcript_24134:395-1420(+)
MLCRPTDGPTDRTSQSRRFRSRRAARSSRSAAATTSGARFRAPTPCRAASDPDCAASLRVVGILRTRDRAGPLRVFVFAVLPLLPEACLLYDPRRLHPGQHEQSRNPRGSAEFDHLRSLLLRNCVVLLQGPRLPRLRELGHMLLLLPRGDRMQADGGSVLLLQGDGSLLLRRLPLRAALLVRLADDVHDPPRPPHLPLRQGRLLRQDGRLRRRQPRRPHLRARRPSARARPPARRSPRYRPGTRRHGSRHHHIRPSQRSQRPDPHRPSPGPPSPRPRQHHASPSLAILRQSEWVFLPSFVRFTTKRKKHAACQNHDNEARCATNKSKNSLSSSRSTRVVVV